MVTQINAVRAALDKVALGLVDEHVRHCLVGGHGGPTDPEAQAAELMGRQDAVEVGHRDRPLSPPFGRLQGGGSHPIATSPTTTNVEEEGAGGLTLIMEVTD